MQHPKTHMVASADQAPILEIHNDDCKIAEDPLERALAATIKKT